MTAEMTLSDGVEEPYTEAARREIANLRVALESSRTIGVALGLLMARYQLSEDQAFNYLARCSQDGNVKVRDLAAQTVHEWQPNRDCVKGETVYMAKR
jgi:AmiR/NasT family two-component response regulator